MRGITRAAKRAGEMTFNAGGGVVNWFPGHMAAASRAIRDRLKLADLVIEVRDSRVSSPPTLSFALLLLCHSVVAREAGPAQLGPALVLFDEMSGLLSHKPIPLSSANEDLQPVLSAKKRIIALNKKDLANQNIMNDCISINAHSKSSVSQLLGLAELKLKEAIMKEPTLLIMVVGVPNVGKSALINSIHRIATSRFPVQDKKKRATVGPLPGVTQDIAGYKPSATIALHLEQGSFFGLDLLEGFAQFVFVGSSGRQSHFRPPPRHLSHCILVSISASARPSGNQLELLDPQIDVACHYNPTPSSLRPDFVVSMPDFRPCRWNLLSPACLQSSKFIVSQFFIASQPSIYVLDTPGVLVPSIPDMETGAVKGSVVGEERIAKYLLSLLNIRKTPLHWERLLHRREGFDDEACSSNEKDSTDSIRRRRRLNNTDAIYVQDLVMEVQSSLCSTFLDFTGNIDEESDLESLIDMQLTALRKVFRIPHKPFDETHGPTSKKLLTLFRSGKLGPFILDDLPDEQ
ncbi:hypothetical protein PR202_gb29342 [Eleusine coracana subsp. coracana]|uniref:G domain-containing protein n=1 Tax=Eleusine coracana subsp. coracana TaxID=191504 RepID=A0AAV5FX02_ELECO|nr:hypothetical protein PR202_gb29342 [Eleusine coracana subsp. coracana]